MNDLMDKIVALCKRRGFIYPGSEIYGGLANSWDYGPLGVELKNNIKNLWWKRFVHLREDIVGIDAAIIMNPRVWKASGHVANFVDPLVECRNCHLRLRADHIAAIEKFKKHLVPGHVVNVTMDEKRKGDFIESQHCEKSKDGKHDWTEAKQFNLMFKTFLGPTEETSSTVYLRPETAQAIFLDFKNIIDTMRVKIPFGVAQIGKAFRNEITPGNFIFRLREFEQMEIEYFIPDPRGDDQKWMKYFNEWLEEMRKWIKEDLGLNLDDITEHHIPDGERAHYSKKTIDFEYNFPFGRSELYGLAYRTDYDLSNHENYLNNDQKLSGKNLKYKDPETGDEYYPHVIEPSLGVERSVLAVLCNSYSENGHRIVLKLPSKLAPYKVAVFPLLANKPELFKRAREIYLDLKQDFMVAWDDRGNIGGRYASQDEIGTVIGITADFQTLENNTVTLRDRDTARQIRAHIDSLKEIIQKVIDGEDLLSLGELVK